MKQEVAQTSIISPDGAIADIIKQFKKNSSEYDAVIFFASSEYNFPEISKKLKDIFSKAEVIGTSTSGELTRKGFTKKTLVVTGIYNTRVRETSFSGLLVPDVDKFPIIHKERIEKAIKKCDIAINSPTSHKDAFAITFINGLCNAEEAFLSLFYAVIKNDKFIIAGGSAGDDLKFQQTYVSYNGETISNGAVVLFVKTICKFDIRKENIFKPSGKTVFVSKADTYNRKIIQIDGKNARKRYAECIGVSESQVLPCILDHPFGRVFGGNVFISSLASFTESGIINMYSRVLQNSNVEILDPLDPKVETEKTLQSLKNSIPKPDVVILVNCILRTISFEQKNLYRTITDLYNSSFPVFCGYSSYGEQIGRVNSNQTLVSIVIGE